MLKSKVITGVRWTLVTSILNITFGIIKLSVLAHYLTQKDFGLMAVVIVVISFIQIFIDLGTNSAIIYFKNISEKGLSSVFWLNILTGLVVYICIYIISPEIERFYNYKNLSEILNVTAITIIVSSVSQIFTALYEKNLNFSILSIITVSSSLASLLTAIYFSINGYGIYAYVYSVIANSLSYSLLMLTYGVKYFRPKLTFSLREIRKLISYGFFQTGDRILIFLHSQFDVLLIGKLLSASELGIFSISKQLSQKPAYTINPVITRVLFPAFSIIEKDRELLKNSYLKLINYISSLNAPIYIFLIFFAKPVTLLLLGKHWTDVSLIFQILCLYYLFRAFGNPVGILLLSIGKANISFYWNMIMIVLIPVFIVLGSFYGVIGVSVSLATVYFLLIFIDWYFLIRRYLNINFFCYHLNIFKPIFLSLISIIPVTLFFNGKNITEVIISGAIYMIFYFTLSLYLNRNFVNTLKEFLTKF